VHLRRALLLFAIVLGFAAIAASLAPPPTDEDADEPSTSVEPPRPEPADRSPVAGAPEELRFVTGEERPERRTVEAGRRAVVTVAVQASGQVAIEGLGLLQAAEPGTPARFDVLLSRAGRYEITFQPVEGQPERIGIIEVEAA
jgi:hypothetical protein